MTGRNLPSLANAIPAITDYVPQRKLSDPTAEAQVIAALMGNYSVAYPQVSGTLAVDDFSSDQWRSCYRAIRSLAAEEKPVNTITVEHALRKLGKYDAVGGESVVATVGLRYEEDITHYRDILVALSIRRQTIARLKDYTARAEAETTDMTQLIDEIAKDSVHFAETATPRTQEVKMAELSDVLRVTERPEIIAPLVTFGETPIARRGDHSLIIGREKSRKSLLIAEIVSIYLRNNPGKFKKVKIFDTEQDREDVWLARERVRKATGQTIDFFNMRGMHPRERRDFIFWASADCELIVIDGIRDCMSNILDPDETTDIIVWLEDMTVRRRLAIINVLHLNKTDGNARGHIGTELSNKALISIEVEYNVKTTFSDVKCRTSRKKPFEPFCFTHGADGQYLAMGTPEAPQDKRGNETLTTVQKDERLAAAFDDRMLKYSEASKAISLQFAIGIRKAETMLAQLVRQGVIIKSGKQGDPKTTYKLVGSAGLIPLEDAVQRAPEPQPAPLFEGEILPDGHQATEDLPF